jgi:nucleoside-diphosphate-sugar epimerase
MKLLIVGCGYVGAALGRSMSKEGHELWGLRRDEGVLEMLPNFGIQPIKADLLNPGTLKNLPLVDTVILCQSPRRDSDNYQNTYVMGTQNLLHALSGASSVKKLIFISSTSVYSTQDASWVDEATHPAKGPYASHELAENAKFLLEAERLVLNSGKSANVLRLGGIYGPHRHRIEAIRSGKWAPKLSDIYTNRIHIEDITSAIRLLIEKGKPGEIYLGVDDEPCTQKEFYTWLYGKLNMPIPAGGDAAGGQQSNKRCSNRKIKELGLVLKYPNYKLGYSSFL